MRGASSPSLSRMPHRPARPAGRPAMPKLHESVARDDIPVAVAVRLAAATEGSCRGDLPAVPAIVRAACGLSQRDLAAMVGWSGSVLSYYERGQRDGMFDIRTVLQFADAVGMPRAALLPLVFADPDADPAVGADDGTSMELNRRDFGGWPPGRSGCRRVLGECPACSEQLSHPLLAGVYGRALCPGPCCRWNHLAVVSASAVAARPASAEGRLDR